MIIVMKPNSSQESISSVTSYIRDHGLEVHLSAGQEVTIIGVVGNKNLINPEHLTVMKDVERILPVTESYKLVNRKFHPQPTVVKAGNATFSDSSLRVLFKVYRI